MRRPCFDIRRLEVGLSQLVQHSNAEVSSVTAAVRRSLVQTTNGRHGGGAGKTRHPDGLVLTNAHVVRRPSLEVRLAAGQSLPALLLAHSKGLDLAALSIESGDPPTIELGRSEQLKPGRWFLAMGHPWEVVGAATAGVVIDVGLPLELPGFGRELVLTDLSLRPGYSGGPLADIRGRLVGIRTMMAGTEVGLAIPLHEIKRFFAPGLGLKVRVCGHRSGPKDRRRNRRQPRHRS
jgi:S1-C subfamily serine protease